MSTPESQRRATWDCSAMHSVVTADGGYVRDGGVARPPATPGIGIEPRSGVLGEPVAVYR